MSRMRSVVVVFLLEVAVSAGSDRIGDNGYRAHGGNTPKVGMESLL